MIHFLLPVITRLSFLLLTTSALSGGALAQSLPDIPPEQIAEDVERRYDSRTGETEYIGGSFDPFEGDQDLAGSVSLRSAGTATTIDGNIVSGGAFLDIATVYTTNSPDDFDVRGFEQVEFMSGQRANIVRYNNKTLDCSRNTDRVTYDDSYYRGASYGYIAGIYRIFPRYRGHRHFDWNRGHWRRGLYGDWRRRHNGYRGDHYRGRRHNSDRDADRRRHGDRDARDRRRDRDNAGRGRRGQDGAHISRPPRDISDPRLPNRRERDRVRSRTPQTDIREGDRRVRGNRNRDGRGARGRDGENRPPRTGRTPESDTQGRNRRQNVKRPATPHTSISTVKTPPPASHRQARPKPPKARVNRAVDKTFKRNNREPRNHNTKRHFYPMVGGYTRTDVYVSYRCVKEETLTVHIPQDRLDAARFDGLVLMMVDHEGREIPVFVPPNYVEGFRRAAGQTVRDSSVTKSYKRTDRPTRRLSHEPITYGDPGYPQ